MKRSILIAASSFIFSLSSLTAFGAQNSLYFSKNLKSFWTVEGKCNLSFEEIAKKTPNGSKGLRSLKDYLDTFDKGKHNTRFFVRDTPSVHKSTCAGFCFVYPSVSYCFGGNGIVPKHKPKEHYKEYTLSQLKHKVWVLTQKKNFRKMRVRRRVRSRILTSLFSRTD